MARDSFRDFVIEQLAALGDVECVRMFGGHGIYGGELFFGIVHDDRLFFKVDDSSRATYEAVGMGPFAPGGKQVLASYHEVPLDVLEDARELCVWARRAMEAQRASGAKPRKRKKEKL